MLLLTGFALGVMAVTFLIVARDFGHLNVGRAFLAILLAGACFVAQPHLPDGLRNVAADISTMVPALFWLLCRVAFSYQPKVLSLSGLLALYTFTAPALSRYIGIPHHEGSIWHLIGWQVPSYGEYIIIALGLWTVWANWEDDLVESRRQLRGIVLTGVGTSVLLVVIPLNTGVVGVWLPYLSINIINLICAYSLLHGRNGVLFGIPSQAVNVPDDAVEIHEEQANNELETNTTLLKQMMDEGFYRTEHLTLKILADQLGLPEYRTRTLINQTLGYRNFSDYINQLRIHEAAQLLLNNLQTPVLNISLDVGYRTLSSFNRAFKDIQKMSPSEYRLQVAQDTPVKLQK